MKAINVAIALAALTLTTTAHAKNITAVAQDDSPDYIRCEGNGELKPGQKNALLNRDIEGMNGTFDHLLTINKDGTFTLDPDDFDPAFEHKLTRYCKRHFCSNLFEVEGITMRIHLDRERGKGTVIIGTMGYDSVTVDLCCRAVIRAF